MKAAPTRMRLSCAGVIVLSIVLVAGCAPDARPPAAVASTSAEVVAVVVGDTIDVATDAGTERVRLIGIDTPEIGREGRAGECYAEQARDYLDDLLYGRRVALQADPTQSDVDDGQSAALLAIEAGAGCEYTYDAPYVDQEAHLEAEASAATEGAGFWGSCG